MKTITNFAQNLSKVLVLVAVAVGFTIMPFVSAFAPSVQAAFCDVNNTTANTNHSSIQDAIDNASDGDTLEVVDGSTCEGFVTDVDNLTIKPETEHGATISDDPTTLSAGRIVDIRSNGVTIDGFVIQSESAGDGVGISISGDGSAPATASIKNNDISDTLTGIQTTTANANGANNIKNNTIDSDYGISLQNASNVVRENSVNADSESIGTSVGTNTVEHNNFISSGRDAKAYANSLDAEKNWWGAANGLDNVEGDVDYEPWLCQPFEDGTGNTSDGGSCDPDANDDTETIVVSGDTADEENDPDGGWLFNRDQDTKTEFEFNYDEASIGDGALYVKPIDGSFNGDDDKFIGEYFLFEDIANIDEISYDFKIGDGGSNSDENEFYMNVYANYGESAEDKYYDCKYDVVPTTGSTGDFTTVTFDPNESYPVTTRGGSSASPYTCPSVPSEMDNQGDGPSTIRMFAINVGDTSNSDDGLDGYYDKVVLNTNEKITTFDFEPQEDPGYFCHANNGNKGYSKIKFNQSKLNAHSGNQGTHDGDIIPPYNGNSEGRNWDSAENQTIWENKCEQAPQTPQICSFSGEVIEHTPDEEAEQNDGDPVESNRRNVSGVENGPESYQNPNGKEGNAWSPGDFFSLGIEGYLVYEFTGQVAFDQSGDDIAIYETTGGPENQQTGEKVGVYVSDDGSNWVSMGTSTGDISLDISTTGLPYVKYVKLVDDSRGVQAPNGDGYDVDGIVILDGSCGDEPEPAICEPGVNLLENPSFENPIVEHNKGWNVFDGDGSSPLAWFAEWLFPEGEAPQVAHVELHNGTGETNGWDASDGEQYTELDSDYDGPNGSQNGESASVRIYQDVPTVEGEEYTLKYDFSARPGTGVADNNIKVFINGDEVDSQTSNGNGTTTNNWTTYTVNFTADDSMTTVEFRDAGGESESDSMGTFLDNTSLMCDEENLDPDPNDDHQLNLSGYKFHNENEDRDRDEGEEKLADWEFRLYEEVAGDWTQIDSATTTEDGNYSFGTIQEAGTYHICEVAQPGWSQVRQDWSGTPYHIVTDNESPNVDEEGPYCATVTYTDEGDRSAKKYFGNKQGEILGEQSCNADILFFDTEHNNTLFDVDETDGSTNSLQNYDGKFHSVLADNDGKLYSIRKNGQLVTLNDDGTVTDLGDTGLNKPVAMDFGQDGYIYVLDQSEDDLYVIDPSNGNVIDESVIGEATDDFQVNGGDVVSTVKGGQIELIYIHKNGKVYAIDPDDAPQASFQELGDVDSPAHITSLTKKVDTYYAIDQDNTFYSFEISGNSLDNITEMEETGPYGFGDSTCAVAPEDKIIETTSVTMCKYDDEERPLYGWALALLGDQVGSTSVDPDGTTATISGVPAGDYVIAGEGTYVYRPSNMLADSLYSERKPTDPGYGSLQDQPWRAVNPSTGHLALQINEDDGANWNGPFNPQHAYYAGTSTSAIQDFDFVITDDNYGDNSGQLTATIYEGYAGQTGEDGCVTFEDVPYGEYEIVEQLQNDWENESGLGEVRVNEENDRFNIYNIEDGGDANGGDDTGSISGEKNNWDTELGIAGWQISLFEYFGSSDGPANNPTATTTTNEGGDYSFDEVPYGTYLVCEEDQNDWNQILPDSQDPNTDECDNGTIGHVVTIGGENQDVEDKDFWNEENEPEIQTFGSGGNQASLRGDNSRVLGDQDGDDEGQVLGEQSGQCEAYLNDFMHPRANNNPLEVLKLQLFLNAWMDAGLQLTQVYDSATEAAVRAFQQKYASDVLTPWGLTEPTGYVYVTTKAKINSLLCSRIQDYIPAQLVPDDDVTDQEIGR